MSPRVGFLTYKMYHQRQMIKTNQIKTLYNDDLLIISVTGTIYIFYTKIVKYHYVYSSLSENTVSGQPTLSQRHDHGSTLT